MSLQLFVDTNVYLSFYHYTSDELDEIRKLIVLVKRKTINLYITQQVIDEWKRNRETKLKDALKNIREQFKFGGYPSFCKEFSGFDELRTTITKFQTLHKDLLDDIDNKISCKTLEADSVLKDLFKVAETLPVDDEILIKAQRRMLVGNPPGKKSSHGDAINWEIILKHAELFSDLHIISVDGDYYSGFGVAKINPFLEEEFEILTVGEIKCYKSLGKFFMENFPDIKLADENEKEQLIQNLANSSSFRSSRLNLHRLSEIDSFSEHQVERILRACFENSQILWILTDVDIKEAVWSFFSDYRENLSESFNQEFLSMWNGVFNPAHPERDNDEDLPF
jgi:hypothetical protein